MLCKSLLSCCVIAGFLSLSSQKEDQRFSLVMSSQQEKTASKEKNMFVCLFTGVQTKMSSIRKLMYQIRDSIKISEKLFWLKKKDFNQLTVAFSVRFDLYGPIALRPNKISRSIILYLLLPCLVSTGHHVLCHLVQLAHNGYTWPVCKYLVRSVQELVYGALLLVTSHWW